MKLELHELLKKEINITIFTVCRKSCVDHMINMIYIKLHQVFTHNKFILTIGWKYLKFFLKEMMNSDLDDDRMLTLKGKDHLYILNDNY